MRVACVCMALAVTVFAAIGWAQADRGQIRGTLSGARGPIPNAEVRIKNTATGEVIVTTTSPAGEFSARCPPAPTTCSRPPSATRCWRAAA